MIVADTSPLILLGKQGQLILLKKCFRKVAVPQEVYNEIIIKQDNAEAIALNKALGESWIDIEKVRITPSLKTKRIANGEKEALSLAEKHNCMLLSDDEDARMYASLLDVEIHGTLFVIHLAYLRHHISKTQARAIFEQVIEDGLYISTDLYALFMTIFK